MTETPRTPIQWYAALKSSIEEIGNAIALHGDYKERLHIHARLAQEAISQNRLAELERKRLEAIEALICADPDICPDCTKAPGCPAFSAEQMCIDCVGRNTSECASCLRGSNQ